MLVCERCGANVVKLYEIGQESDYDGEVITKKVCWDCDHDVTNGGDLFENAGDVILDRWENDYAYDPINTEKPWWMP